jgi:hypothetical protein
MGEPPSRADPVAAALAATRESKAVALKPQVSSKEPKAWLELVRDVVAMANSGGGTIVVGVDRTGTPTGWRSERFLRLGGGELLVAVAHHVGEPFDDIRVTPATKRGHRIAVIRVGPRSGSPLVFEKAGTHPGQDGTSVTVFGRGTLYFRHGRRSGPALARDLARFTRTELAHRRRDLMRNLRRVSTAPTGSEIIVVPPASGPAGEVERFRVVDDPSAPALSRTDFDVTHPFRQKEVATAFNERTGQQLIGPYELQCVRRAFGIDARPEFFHRPKFGSPQYSDAFVSWLLSEWRRDPTFFDKAREAGRPR